MKLFYAIAGAFFILNFNVFSQIPSDAHLLIQISKLSETNFSGTLSNTQPDVQYEFQRKQDKTNWVSMGYVLGSETTNWTAFNFKTTNAVNSKTIRVRSWIDSQGVGMADWWQLRYFGDVGVDPYGNPEGDGWSNMQKYQNGMDPFTWYRPREPAGHLTFMEGKDTQHENAVLSWMNNNGYNGPPPDYFIIERANRTLRPVTNNWPSHSFVVNGRMVTNRMPNFRPPNGFRPPYGRPGQPPQDSFVTEPFEVIASVPGQPSVRDYQYTDTNVNAFPGPIYRIQAHYTEPPPFAKLHEASAEAVRRTILSVTSKQETNGYIVTVLHPPFHVRYLLLVRDKKDEQWRASGYFVTGTNGNPMHLHVDKMGMMSDEQNPIALPVLKFLPEVVHPEFTAGYGEDSDGDYLPDIYEVLVTHTDPANDDTGDTSVIDGCKEMTGDGWSNLEKFRRRANPLKPSYPPAPVELTHPTWAESASALSLKTDLPYKSQVQIRTNGATSFQPLQQLPWQMQRMLMPRNPHERGNFDLIISWQIPEAETHRSGGGP